ncbi:MAG: zinc transporter ZntB [Desulfobacterales bacterium]|nr:MAG: zinc transporter ZntB [Desulfobacterales bacterium]
MASNDGLIYAYILDGVGGGTAVDWQRLGQWRPEKGPLWIHLDYSTEQAKQWLQSESELSALSCDILTEQDTRPRFIATREGFLLILRGVNCNPGADPDDMVALRMSFEESRIITMRQRKVMAVTDIHEAIAAGTGPKSIAEFLTAVIDRIVDRMGDVIAEIDDQVDELEDTVLTAESYELRSKLARIRRQCIGLRRYIAPQRDVLTRLQNERLEWFSDRVKLRLRELSERTARFIEDLDSARDRAAITHEELSSRLTDQMNKAMYVLSIVAAIFLPLGLLTGLLGINVGGIPGTENKWAFLIVTFALILIALILLGIFRRIKWL